jgi:hypothetical protein
MNWKHKTPAIISIAEIKTVHKKTAIITTNSFPSFSVLSRLAIDDAMVKKINGMIAVKASSKKYHLAAL